jgi:hypothetical protein
VIFDCAKIAFLVLKMLSGHYIRSGNFFLKIGQYGYQ